MKLSSFVAKTASLAIKFGDETLNVVYSPAAYTPAFEDAVHAAGAEEGKDSLTQLAAGLLLSWDLQDDDGATIGVDVASLRALPIKLLAEILKPIVDQMSPSPKKADA